MVSYSNPINTCFKSNYNRTSPDIFDEASLSLSTLSSRAVSSCEINIDNIIATWQHYHALSEINHGSHFTHSLGHNASIVASIGNALSCLSEPLLHQVFNIVISDKLHPAEEQKLATILSSNNRGDLSSNTAHAISRIILENKEIVIEFIKQTIPLQVQDATLNQQAIKNAAKILISDLAGYHFILPKIYRMASKLWSYNEVQRSEKTVIDLTGEGGVCGFGLAPFFKSVFIVNTNKIDAGRTDRKIKILRSQERLLTNLEDGVSPIYSNTRFEGIYAFPTELNKVVLSCEIAADLIVFGKVFTSLRADQQALMLDWAISRLTPDGHIIFILNDPKQVPGSYAYLKDILHKSAGETTPDYIASQMTKRGFEVAMEGGELVLCGSSRTKSILEELVRAQLDLSIKPESHKISDYLKINSVNTDFRDKFQYRKGQTFINSSRDGYHHSQSTSDSNIETRDISYNPHSISEVVSAIRTGEILYQDPCGQLPRATQLHGIFHEVAVPLIEHHRCILQRLDISKLNRSALIACAEFLSCRTLRSPNGLLKLETLIRESFFKDPSQIDLGDIDAIALMESSSLHKLWLNDGESKHDNILEVLQQTGDGLNSIFQMAIIDGMSLEYVAQQSGLSEDDIKIKIASITDKLAEVSLIEVDPRYSEIKEDISLIDTVSCSSKVVEGREESYAYKRIACNLQNRMLSKLDSYSPKPHNSNNLYSNVLCKSELLTIEEERELTKEIVDLRRDLSSEVFGSYLAQEQLIQILSPVVGDSGGRVNSVVVVGWKENTQSVRDKIQNLIDELRIGLVKLRSFRTINVVNLKENEINNDEKSILESQISLVKSISFERNVFDRIIASLRQVADDISSTQYTESTSAQRKALQILHYELLLGESYSMLCKRLNNIEIIHNHLVAAEHVLLKANLRLVANLAKRYKSDDVFSAGQVGLSRAILRFDPSLGNKFSTYATWWIKQAIRRMLNDESRIIRYPVHIVESINKISQYITSEKLKDINREITDQELLEVLDLQLDNISYLRRLAEGVKIIGQSHGNRDNSDVTLLDFASDNKELDPSNSASLSELRKAIQILLGNFDPLGRLIISMRFGLGLVNINKGQLGVGIELEFDPDSYGLEYTLEEIAELLGVTRERIRQLEYQVLKFVSNPETKVNRLLSLFLSDKDGNEQSRDRSLNEDKKIASLKVENYEVIKSKAIANDKRFSLLLINIGMTKRTVNALRDFGVYDVYDLLSITRKEFLSIPTLGEKTLIECLECLQSIGFQS